MIPISNLSEEEATGNENPEQEAQQPTEQDNLGLLIAALDGIEGAPADYELEEWKNHYGNYFVSTVHGDDTYYIWRTLKRAEYKGLVNSGVARNQISYEEAVIMRCVLWPKFSREKVAGTDAGVIETVSKQILFQSGFVPDQMAMNLIKTI